MFTANNIHQVKISDIDDYNVNFNHYVPIRYSADNCEFQIIARLILIIPLS